MNKDQKRITVMTLNLRFGLAEDGYNSWENRKNAYPELFHNNRPDFLGVQEANTFQTLYLNELLDSYRFIGMRDSSPEFWQDNVIFYNASWNCIQKKLYFLSNTPEIKSKFFESKWPRQCTIGLFENQGHSLIHVNTHFDFKSSVQEKSACLVLEFLDEFPANTPTVITGDFNTSPDSNTYQVFSDHGFRDLFRNEHSSTFHGFTGKDLGGHIDWILYKGRIKGVEHRIIRDPFAGVYPSDHYPVISVFEFSDTNG